MLPVRNDDTNDLTQALTPDQAQLQVPRRRRCRCCSCVCDEASCPGVCHAAHGFSPKTPGKGFLALATLEGLFEVAFCVYVLMDSELNDNVYTWFNCGLALWVTFAFVYFAWDAVWAENAAQVFSAIAMSVFGTVYIAFKFVYPDEGLGETWEQSKLVVLLAKCVFQAMYIGLAYPVVQSFGFSAWKVIGGDSKLNEMYTNFLWAWALLRLDLVLAATLVLMYGFFFSDRSRFQEADNEILLNSAALVVTLAVAIFAWLALTQEWRSCLYLFYFWSLAQPTYIGYKMYCIFSGACFIPQAALDAGTTQFLVLGGFAIVMKVACIVSVARCHGRFGEGLKSRVFLKSAS